MIIYYKDCLFFFLVFFLGGGCFFFVGVVFDHLMHRSFNEMFDFGLDIGTDKFV